MDLCYWDRFSTPLGTLSLALDERGRITRLDLQGRPSENGRRDATRCAEARRELMQYFDGDRQAFEVACAPSGTAFQQRVWRALSQIPYGEVCHYGELARRIGQPGAARAVGQANGANPIPIIIPCHRVIAHDGSIGGYSGGLGVKRALLSLERVRLAA